MIFNCKKCKKQFDKNLSEVRRSTNHFCGRSCANSYNNCISPKRKKKQWTCIECGLEVSRRQKYCDPCRTTKFRACAKTTQHKIKKTIEFFLVKGRECSTNSLRKKLIRESFFDHCCQECRLTEWNSQPISLELHHIDGDKANNLLSNLTILCPNCHAQTDTYRGKNKKG